MARMILIGIFFLIASCSNSEFGGTLLERGAGDDRKKKETEDNEDDLADEPTQVSGAFLTCAPVSEFDADFFAGAPVVMGCATLKPIEAAACRSITGNELRTQLVPQPASLQFMFAPDVTAQTTVAASCSMQVDGETVTEGVVETKVDGEKPVPPVSDFFRLAFGDCLTFAVTGTSRLKATGSNLICDREVSAVSYGRFSASQSRVVLTYPEDLDNKDDGDLGKFFSRDFTVSLAVILTRSNTSAGNKMMLFDGGADKNGRVSIEISYEHTKKIKLSATVAGVSLEQTAHLVDNSPHLMTLRRAGGELELFVNESSVAKKPFSKSVPSFWSATLGNSQETDAAFYGYMGDALMVKQALSEKDLNALYRKLLGAQTPLDPP